MTTDTTIPASPAANPSDEGIKSGTNKPAQSDTKKLDAETKPNVSSSDYSENFSKKKSNSDEYFHELREENKQHRLNSQTLQKELDNTNSELKRLNEALVNEKKRVEDNEKRAKEIQVFSELKTEAIKSGIINIDDVYKLADHAQVKINDRGEIEGAAESIKSLKTQRPYLFRDPSNPAGFTNLVPQPGNTQRNSKEKLTSDQINSRVAEVKAKFR